MGDRWRSTRSTGPLRRCAQDDRGARDAVFDARTDAETLGMAGTARRELVHSETDLQELAPSPWRCPTDDGSSSARRGRN